MLSGFVGTVIIGSGFAGQHIVVVPLRFIHAGEEIHAEGVLCGIAGQPTDIFAACTASRLSGADNFVNGHRMQHGDHAELRDGVGQVQQEDGIGGLPQRSLLQRVVHALADQQADEGQHDQRRNPPEADLIQRVHAGQQGNKQHQRHQKDEQRLCPAAVVPAVGITGSAVHKNVEDERNRRKYPQIGGEAADGTVIHGVPVRGEQAGAQPDDDGSRKQQQIFLGSKKDSYRKFLLKSKRAEPCGSTRFDYAPQGTLLFS